MYGMYRTAVNGTLFSRRPLFQSCSAIEEEEEEEGGGGGGGGGE